VEHRSNDPSNGNRASEDWEGHPHASPAAPRDESSETDAAPVDGLPAAELPSEDMSSEDSGDELVATKEPDAVALASVLETARGYAEDSKAANTRRAYRADWADL
jgi:hypothetical protein